jgi:acyl-coenzyme A synthetase/AMP-(fatty) acid ligase
MPHGDSLWGRVAARGRLGDRLLRSAEHDFALSGLADGSSLDHPIGEFANRSVLVATADQLTAALSLIELDGIARRLVLCTPDLSAEHITAIAETAEIDVVVSDGRLAQADLVGNPRLAGCSPRLRPAGRPREPAGSRSTEWVLLTSGTTGAPKLVVHTLSSLIGPIKPTSVPAGAPPVWSTFYDIRRYGGLQILLRAILGGGSLVLSTRRETTANFLARVGRCGVTHISGTPSHWRRALMSGAGDRMAPHYVRLSGEIADEAILDDLRAVYRSAEIGHAFASTEAGVAFEVNDGLAGFPAELIGRTGAEVEMKIEDGSLRICSGRTASRYLGRGAPALRNDDGFVDTGDMLDLQGDRYHFVGRRDGIINVGGLKVHPEQIEAVINRHPAVQMSLVKARKNPFTGAVVVAEIVARTDGAGSPDIPATLALQREILEICHRNLPPHKVPAAIRLVASLEVGAAGKLARLDA